MVILIMLAMSAAAAACPAAGVEKGAICAVLMAQQEAWNRADLDTFLRSYEQNEEVTFSGKAGVTRGIRAVTERYRRAYGTREAMGTLRFALSSVRLLGSGAALVLGEFHLERSGNGGGNASGHFSLVLRKGPDGWRILHDHTS